MRPHSGPDPTRTRGQPLTAAVFNRPLPFSLEAEESTLGGCLLDPSKRSRIQPFLQPAMFYRESHQWIYQALLRLDGRGAPIDLLTVCDELERLHLLESIGGHARLSRLLVRTPTALHTEYYARIVEHRYLLRMLVAAGEAIAHLAFEAERELPELCHAALAILQEKVLSIGPFTSVLELQHAAGATYEAVGDAERLVVEPLRSQVAPAYPPAPLLLPPDDATFVDWFTEERTDLLELPPLHTPHYRK